MGNKIKNLKRQVKLERTKLRRSFDKINLFKKMNKDKVKKDKERKKVISALTRAY